MPSPPSTVSNTSRYSEGGATIARAETELMTAVESHIAHLEQQLANRDLTIHAMKVHMENTMNDFRINEQLIVDRDADIDELTRLVDRLHREKANLSDSLAKEKAVAADATRRVQELTVQLQNLRLIHEESVADHQVAIDRLRSSYEEQLRQASQRHLSERDQETQLVTSKLHTTEDARIQHIREVEAAAEQRVRFAQQRTDAMQDQLRVHEATIAMLREEVKNVRAESQRREMELFQWQNNTQELQQSFDMTKAERTQEVELLQARLRDLEAIHQAKVSELKAQLQRAGAEAADLRQQLQRGDVRLLNVSAERDELARRELATAETFKAEVRKIEDQFSSMKGELDTRVRELLKENTTLRTDNRKAELQLEECRGELARLRSALEREEGTSATLRRDLADRADALERSQTEVHELDRKLRAANVAAAKAEDALRLSSQTANDTIEDLRRQVDSARTAHVKEATALQSEVARLRQELSSSEAIRLEVEDQLQRHMQNDNAREVQRLSEERKQLVQQVHALELANEAIRHQVQQFTAEMQNDPVLRNAKEAAQRAAELEERLREARAELQALRDRGAQQERELRTFEQERVQLQRDAQRLYHNERADVAELKRQLRDKQSTIDALTSGREGEATAKVAMHRAATARVEQLEDRVAELSQDRERLESENARLRDEIRHLQKLNNAQHAELLNSTRAHEAAVSAMRLQHQAPPLAPTPQSAAAPTAPAAVTATPKTAAALEAAAERDRVAASGLAQELEKLVMRAAAQRAAELYSGAPAREDASQGKGQHAPHCDTCVATDRVRQRREDHFHSSESIYASGARPASASRKAPSGSSTRKIGGASQSSTGGARRLSPQDRFREWGAH